MRIAKVISGVDGPLDWLLRAILVRIDVAI